MPTDAELDRLGALLERLGPLGRKQRGELIRSAEWNDLVGTVGELTRAVLGEDRVTVVAPHQHDEQVSLGWLGQDLRRLLTEGPLNDVSALGRLARLERTLANLTAQLDGLAAELDGQRTRVTAVATNDLARESTLTNFGRRLDGIGDARDDVAGVRRTLENVQIDVLRAIQVGQQLEVDGEPIDVSGLLGRVGELEELRTRLTLPDGQLLDAAEFERQVNVLETRLVTEQELDEALGTVRRAELPPGVLDQIATQAADTAGERLSGRLTSLETDLRGELTTQFGAVDELVAATIAGAVPEITASAVARAEALVSDAVAELDATVRAAFTADLESRIGALSTSVNERFAAQQEGLPDRVATALAALIPGELAPLDTRLGQLEGRVVANEAVATRADEQSLAAATRVETVTRDAAAARAEMITTLGRRIDELSGRIGTRIATAVTEAEATATANIRNEMNAMRTSIEAGLATTAAEAARTEARLLQGQLDTNVRALVQDELVATRAELLRQIDGRFAANETRLDGLVTTEVRRATGNMQEMVRTEVEARLGGSAPPEPRR